MNTDWLWRLVHLEPVRFRTAVTSVTALLFTLGIYVAPGLDDRLVAAVVALAGLVSAVWIRPAVLPTDKVLAYLPDPDRPARVKAGDATTTASDSVVLAAVKTDPADLDGAATR
jgi:hypothetical protein